MILSILARFQGSRGMLRPGLRRSKSSRWGPALAGDLSDQLGAPVDPPAAGNVRPLAVIGNQIVEGRPVAIGQRLAEPADDLDVLLDGHERGVYASMGTSLTDRSSDLQPLSRPATS